MIRRSKASFARQDVRPPMALNSNPVPAMAITPTANRLFMALNEPFTGACPECSMMCVREHGTRRHCSSKSFRPPCFFKPVADYSVEGGPSCWMQVPPAFVRKYLPHVDRRRMVLENADGKPWPVMYSVEHGFFTGWSEFSTANKLAIGDTLFFSLVEEAKFVVHVFSRSGCEKHVPTETPPTTTQRRKNTTQTHATPTPSPRLPPGFARFPPDESGDRNRNRGERDGFRTPAPLSYGGTHHESGDDNTTPPNLPAFNSKGWSTSETYKIQSQSVPATRNTPAPSWQGFTDIDAGPSTCPNSKQLGQQGEHPSSGEKKAPTWGPTWSQIQARALVAKAKLRKMNITVMPAFKHRVNFKPNRNSLTRKNMAESVQSDGDGFDASSGFDGGRVHGGRERRSFSKDGAFVSSLDSLRDYDEDEGGVADLQAFAYGTTRNANVASGRFRGGPPRQQGTDSFNEIPEYVTRRKPGRPRKYPVGTCAAQQMRGALPESSARTQNGDGSQAMVVRTKPKRGRPFKHQAPGLSDLTTKPLREIFVSRRRNVTQAERDEALHAAYTYASQKHSTTFVIVMRQSFVYRNFVLGVSRRFGQRYMPDCNKDVTLVDDEWKAWFCAWNAAYKYISGRGWRNFALEHCLEEDDALLMEIVSETDAMLTIKVHIFRVVAIRDGLTGWQSHVCPPNCYPETNSGVLIEPILHLAGKKQPRLRTRHRSQPSGKRIKREPLYTEYSTMSESSEEFD